MDILFYRACMEHRQRVIDAYTYTRDMTPGDTVKMIVGEVGHNQAAIDIAECVNATSHDGRLSKKTIDWAKSVSGAAGQKELEEAGIYGLVSWIHTSHLEQIAQEYIKNYNRETEINDG